MPDKLKPCPECSGKGYIKGHPDADGDVRYPCESCDGDETRRLTVAKYSTEELAVWVDRAAIPDNVINAIIALLLAADALAASVRAYGDLPESSDPVTEQRAWDIVYSRLIDYEGREI